MSGNFLDRVTELLMSERLGEELSQNTQYKEAIAEEERIFEELNNSIDEKHQTLLKDYFNAVNATLSIVEGLTYKQGMKDLLSLFRSLSDCDEYKILRISK